MARQKTRQVPTQQIPPAIIEIGKSYALKATGANRAAGQQMGWHEAARDRGLPDKVIALVMRAVG